MKCYSNNEESFNHQSIEEAVADLLERGPYLRTGETAILHEADAVKRPASYYLPNISEYMEDQAADECGEAADGWDFTKIDRESLQAAVEKIVDQWAAEKNMQPHFYAVENIVPIAVKFTNDNGAFEIISGENSKLSQPDCE